MTSDGPQECRLQPNHPLLSRDRLEIRTQPQKFRSNSFDILSIWHFSTLDKFNCFLSGGSLCFPSFNPIFHILCWTDSENQIFVWKFEELAAKCPKPPRFYGAARDCNSSCISRYAAQCDSWSRNVRTGSSRKAVVRTPQWAKVFLSPGWKGTNLNCWCSSIRKKKWGGKFLLKEWVVLPWTSCTNFACSLCGNSFFFWGDLRCEQQSFQKRSGAAVKITILWLCCTDVFQSCFLNFIWLVEIVLESSSSKCYPGALLRKKGTFANETQLALQHELLQSLMCPCKN